MLKSEESYTTFRNVVLRRRARIELEQDAGVRSRPGRFIVLGGGFSGIECAGELADCLRGIRRYYPRVRDGELSITLLHDLPQLLPELAESLGAAARRSLTERGVDVRTGVRAARVCDVFVEWTWGMFFPSDITHLRFTRSIDLESSDSDELPAPSAPGSEGRVASLL